MTLHVFTLYSTVPQSLLYAVICVPLSVVMYAMVTENMYLQPPQMWARQSSADPHQNNTLSLDQTARPHRLLDSGLSPPPREHELFRPLI